MNTASSYLNVQIYNVLISMQRKFVDRMGFFLFLCKSIKFLIVC